MLDANGRFVPDIDMYTVLLVDDEKSVRESIKASIDRNRLRIAMVQEAENGIEGLDQILEHVPDIVFLDIHMPRMDGIEFASIIRRRFPHIRIVIISGYDRFEYVQRALRLGVNDYILKPFLNERIPKIIEEQLAALKEESAGSYTTAAGQGADVMRVKLANHLLQGGLIDQRERSDYFGDFIRAHGADCFYIHFGTRSVAPNSCQTFDFAMSSLAESTLSAGQFGFSFETYNNELAAVYFGDPETLCQVLDTIRIQFSRMTDSSAFIAVSGSGDLKDLALMREQALEAERKCFLGINPMLVYYDDILKQDAPFEYPSEVERHMLSKCFYASAQELIPTIDSFFSCIHQSDVDSQACRYVLIRLLTKLSNCIDSFNSLNMSMDFYENFDPIDTVQSFHSIHEARQWLIRLFDAAYDFCHMTDNIRTETFCQIRNYVHQHYATESLNLKKCSDDLFLSYGYITRVLKREINRTFVEYLNEHRTQKAKELLKNSQLPMSKISELVGFTHASYFSAVFKKYEKCTPQQYRQQKPTQGHRL